MLFNLLMTENSQTTSMPNVSRGGAPIGPIVGVVISVFLLLILGVAIAVVILYLVRHRNTGGNYSTGRRASEKKAVIECKLNHVHMTSSNNNSQLRPGIQSWIWSRMWHMNHQIQPKYLSVQILHILSPENHSVT